MNINIPTSFLTAEGKKYARLAFLTHNFVSRIPWIGKYGIGIMVSICYTTILKEGAQEHARLKREAKLSRMRRRVSVSKERGKRGNDTSGQVSEMRIHTSGIHDNEAMASSIREGEGNNEEEATTEEG